MGYLLDTNILTALIKKNQKVLDKTRDIKLTDEELFISCITYFESEGGLLAINSQNKLAILEKLCQNDLKVLFLDQIKIINIASRIYADLRKKGTPIQLPDILIASTAIYHDLVLVSDDSDMLRVEDLMLENWLE
jgi:tRNA(fMet)-specific endonuclease VapC